MGQIQDIVNVANQWIWGPPLLIFLVIVGLYLTIRTRGVQFRYFYYAHKIAFTKGTKDEKEGGDISHFEALMTALAGTIGIGSITGVATAVSIGGLGSIFWMWVAACFGMATKYGEGILAVKFREKDEKGEMSGGPMYYIDKGLGWRWLAILFALFAGITALSTGNMIQANSVALAVNNLLGWNPLWTGALLAVAVASALLGGIKSIGKVVAILVPAMAAFFIAGGLLIIFYKIQAIPSAFGMIFRAAWSGSSAVGGFAGATVMMAIQLGVSRGIFSSEAGLGTSPIAAAAAKTDTPGRQALVSMCSVFITTGIVCTITALVIAVSGVFGEIGVDGKALNGSALALRAFDAIIPYGGLMVTIALIPFAYSTILGWAYYGEKCMEYLFGERSVIYYRLVAITASFFGALLSLDLVWGIANALNGLMALPNLIGLFALGGIIGKETRHFDAIVRKERGK
ncbi:MAG: sodium:alanine symporter family protein [Chlamydiota bacterium]|nr:sodium:alanine symporter family protein [Chlamydiota bacterium]